MVMLAMILGDLKPQTTLVSTFSIAIHVFVVGEFRDFKFGTQVDCN